MKSPFPGMDPYLEQHWEDVHTALIGYIRDELQPQLAEDLIARMEEKVYVEDETERRRRRPDVRIAENPTPWNPRPGSASTAVMDKPVLLQPVGDPIRQRSVLIYDTAGNRIITAIEILSPWNKIPGRPMNQYLEKREKYLQTDMNLIEIDLVRTGDWTQMVGRRIIPEEWRSTYRVTICTPDQEGVYLYPISLRTRLPTIGVPLRSHDAPAALNLQGLIEKAYTMGRYDRIDYSKQCVPPLENGEKDWASGLTARNST